MLLKRRFPSRFAMLFSECVVLPAPQRGASSCRRPSILAPLEGHGAHRMRCRRHGLRFGIAFQRLGASWWPFFFDDFHDTLFFIKKRKNLQKSDQK